MTSQSLNETEIYEKEIEKVNEFLKSYLLKKEENIKVFSFCLYGNNKKYTEGMLENIEIITKDFLDYEIWIFGGDSVSSEYIEKYKTYKNVLWISTTINTAFLMCMRFFPLSLPEKIKTCFIRDADSRIYNRDQWCIREFLQSDYQYHTIRDHYYHKARIMGGLLGWKYVYNENENNNILYDLIEWKKKSNNADGYNTDAEFLEKYLYPKIRTSLLIHSNIIGFKGEKVFPIMDKNQDRHDFIGNVYEYNENGKYPSFTTDYPIKEHLYWLDTQSRNDLISLIGKSTNILSYSPTDRYDLLDKFSVANYYLEDIPEFMRILSLFKHTHVNEHIINNSNYFISILKKNGYKIIGTTNPDRKPCIDKKEVIICYGSYGHDVYNLPFSFDQTVYRHALYYNKITHDSFEYDDCWEDIEQIYILNLVERVDRYAEILCELSHMNAPLHRIYHVKGEKNEITDSKILNSYLGATESHLVAAKHMKNNCYKNGLILEDDFTFNFNYDEHKENLKKFFERKYIYDVCLISYSKFHNILPFDDLLSYSFQECTTTSGYLLSLETVDSVIECFQEGYDKMLETRDYNTYVCDRYWAKLQKNSRFYLFNKKMGYQRLTYSDIQKRVNYNFD